MRDITGQTHGKLTAIKYAGNGLWECKCECGNTALALTYAITSGNKSSCGCIRPRRRSKNERHGMHGIPEYHIWYAIRRRCFDPNHKDFPGYGGRGITMSPQWADSFVTFISHVGRRPSPDMTLDRIDNDLGYLPGNVRWTTKSIQQRNKRSNRLIEVNGESMCVAEAAERFGIPYRALVTRLDMGWDTITAVTKPLRQTKRTRNR